ncbi:hypothetical protein FAIPA1_40004 [Frankia sp. AiPs1]|uniref:helix-turn-helix domain-containing protein n=1 Tax=Frankia sp. AiPa1 TaxID=573492 RepID=UPI00202B813D|nr:helix-turn-helix transcriptional regulator [Frankia sp. AiPa1]MCL9760097.1 helix-turn-helix domain-containing protein [Frankia sp. AiPa1]
MARTYGRLALRRRAMGYTQESFAARLGVDRTTVGRWERDEAEPQPDIRSTIADVLDVSLTNLPALLEARSTEPSDIPSTITREPIGEDQLEQARIKIGSLLAAERAFGGRRSPALRRAPRQHSIGG